MEYFQPRKSSLVYYAAFPGETNTPNKSVSILITVCPQATLATVQHFWDLQSILCCVHKDRLDCLISAPNPAGKSRYQFTSIKDTFYCKIFLQEIHRSLGTGEFPPCTSDYTLNNYTSHFTKY